MSKKLQFNIRMDKEPELMEEMKKVAAENEMSLNDFAIAAFRAIVELRTPVKLSRMFEKINSLEGRITNLESECKNLNLQLAKQKKAKSS